MNKKAITAFIIVLALIGTGALFLNNLRNSYRLSEPGLKLSNEPLYDNKENLASTNRVDLPKQVLGSVSETVNVTHQEVTWLPDDTTFGRRRYRSFDGNEILISVVLMGTDRTSIHKPQYCLTGQGFRIEKTESSSIPIDKPFEYQLPVKKLTMTKEIPTKEGKVKRSAVFVYWFVSKDQLTANHWERVWLMARDLVTQGVLKRWAYVAVFSLCRPGQEEATYRRMKDFIAAAVPKFQKTTPTPGQEKESSRTTWRR